MPTIFVWSLVNPGVRTNICQGRWWAEPPYEWENNAVFSLPPIDQFEL